MSRYVIGGVAFATAEVLPGLDRDGFSDIEVAVHFDAGGGASATPTVRSVAGPVGLSGTIDPDSLICRLPDVYGDPAERAWQLRQMSPIFSSVLERLVLHASAVDTDAGVVGLIGASGAGKSTLAGRLAERGHRFVADDLLPVRFAAEPLAPVDRRLRQIAALVFLRRVPVDTPLVTELRAAEALPLLIGNGFGEHGDSETWSFQFDAYHRLVESVPHFSIAVPDDPEAIEATTDSVDGIVDLVG